MTVESTRRSSQAQQVGASQKASSAALEITAESSDPGIQIKADPKNNRVLIKGVAEGPKVKYLDDDAYVGGVKTKQVDYEVARGVSFQVDHSKMPDFSKDADYTRKNQWYFAHLANTGTTKGDSALKVARDLAESINKGGALKATVSSKGDGAVIDLKPA